MGLTESCKVMSAILVAAEAHAPIPRGPEPQKPQCLEASHMVLKVQPGRDVCSPTILPKGGAVSVGYLPTTCPPNFRKLVVDAVGDQDVCRNPDREAAPPAERAR